MKTGRAPLLLAAGLLLAAVAPERGAAHVWYPRACCNDQDCFRADRVEHRADGSLAIRAGPINVIVPPGFEVQPSLDADAHVCVWRDGLGRYHARCVFMPGIG